MIQATQSMVRRVIVLGPQRHSPSVHAAVDSFGVGGRVATVTAGWEEREGEDQELIEHLGRSTVNLGLFPRAEDVFASDPELLGATRERQDTLKRMREFYSMRLSPELEIACELAGRRSPDVSDPVLDEALDAAIDGVRALDAHHLERVTQVHAEYEERWRPRERDAVVRHRRELETLLADCGVVCIAGGHVGVLLDRMELFGVLELFRDMPIVAWSGGAMVLSPRIVLFHDSPPQGAGAAEILRAGLGAFEGLLVLPHAKHRLRLDDPLRIGVFARRFAPAMCGAFDDGARLDWDGSRWVAAYSTVALREDGTVGPMQLS